MSRPWRPRALELFSGSGGWADALEKDGWRVDRFDWLLCPGQNALKERVRRSILGLVFDRWYLVMHSAPPCSSCSSARFPPIRSNDHPLGLPTLPARDCRKCKVGNLLGLFALVVLEAARDIGIAASLEQPATSWMLRWPPSRALIQSGTVSAVTFDFCAFGVAWSKRTTVIYVNCDLMPLRRPCPGNHEHVVFRGRSPCGRPWTSMAQPYPGALCRAWASCLCKLIV